MALFSKASILGQNESPKGITTKEAEDVIEAFKSRFPGAAQLDFLVRGTQEDAFGPDHGIEERVKGAYYGKSGRVLINTGNLSDAREAEQVIQHEILGHHGLNLFDADTKRKILERVAQEENSIALRSVFNRVKKDGYAADDKLKLAEEAVAYPEATKRPRARMVGC